MAFFLTLLYVALVIVRPQEYPGMVELALPILRPGGMLLALKGRSAEAEIEAARGALRRWRCPSAEVPRVGPDAVTVVSITRPAGGTTVPPAPATSGSKAKRR